MTSRPDLITALASGAHFTTNYDGDAGSCWVDIEVPVPLQEPLKYRVGPYKRPGEALDELEAILIEAKRA